MDNRAIVRALIGRELWSIKEYRPQKIVVDLLTDVSYAV